MSGTVILALLKRFAPYLLGISAALALWFAAERYISHVRSTVRTEQATRDQVVLDKLTADVKQAHADAAALDAKRNAEVAAAYANGRKESDDALQPALDDAHARLTQWMRQHATLGAAAGSSGATQLPGAPNAPAVTDRTDTYAVVAGDLDACTEAVTRLLNAKAWAATLDKVPQ